MKTQFFFGGIISLTIGAAATMVSATVATAAIIQDGTFLQPIGTGSNQTPWSDWTKRE
jgi:hypothetical protein